MTTLDILRINPSDTYEIRNLMLRPGAPVSECMFAGDDDDQTFHLGAFIDSKLVSVASFYFENHPEIVDHEYQYRLRGMATLETHQRQGLSKALLKMAFPIIKQNQCTLLWCNARTTAKGFYETVGFVSIGEEFNIADVGPHFLMKKDINQPL